MEGRVDEQWALLFNPLVRMMVADHAMRAEESSRASLRGDTKVQVADVVMQKLPRRRANSSDSNIIH